MLTAWLAEHPHPNVFSHRDGRALTRDALRRIVERHTVTAAHRCPTLAAKTVTPHTLRHSCAMQLLRAGVDIAVIGLILGHASAETTRIYLHADPHITQRALDRVAPPGVPTGHYQPSDTLLAFLDQL